MNKENRIRFAGLMEEYLNIPSFVCELIEKQLQDNKYKEVIEYVVQRRNEIENKEDYLSEQEKINQYLDLQQKVERLENIRKEAIEYVTSYESISTIQGLDAIEKNKILDEKTMNEMVNRYLKVHDNLLNILNKGDNNGK